MLKDLPQKLSFPTSKRFAVNKWIEIIRVSTLSVHTMDSVVFIYLNQSLSHASAAIAKSMPVKDLDLLYRSSTDSPTSLGNLNRKSSPHISRARSRRRGIRYRPYRWEGLLSDPTHKGVEGRRKWLLKLEGVWPLAALEVGDTFQWSLGVKLKNGPARYVHLHDVLFHDWLSLSQRKVRKAMIWIRVPS